MLYLIKNNNIMHLEGEHLVGLVACRTLNLSRNYLGTTADTFPADLRNLLVLDASHNRIKDIPAHSFKHLTRLVRLDLKGNLLNVISPDVFRSMASLKALDLEDNAFSALPLEAIRVVDNTLETIRLEGKTNAQHNIL